MAELSEEILKLLLGAEEKAARAVSAASKDDPAEVHHATRPVLMERVSYLKKMARVSEGEASETLHAYPRHSVMLSVRLRSGIAEQHARFADLFLVLDGRATLLSGGTMSKTKNTGPGENRGEALNDARVQELRPGDIAHIPAGTPHQILLSGDATFAAIVVKIEES